MHDTHKGPLGFPRGPFSWPDRVFLSWVACVLTTGVDMQGLTRGICRRFSSDRLVTSLRETYAGARNRPRHLLPRGVILAPFRGDRLLRERFTLLAACLVAGQAILTAGCSNQPPTYPVSGQVTFSDGEPVDSGTIEYRSDELGLNARGKISSDGSYQLTTFRPGDGAVAGDHKVVIVQHIVVETPRPVEHGGSGHAHKPHRAVDRSFANYRETPLVGSVSDRDENVIDLVVESRSESMPFSTRKMERVHAAK